jgi:hypothetical protein
LIKIQLVLTLLNDDSVKVNKDFYCRSLNAYLEVHKVIVYVNDEPGTAGNRQQRQNYSQPNLNCVTIPKVFFSKLRLIILLECKG